MALINNIWVQVVDEDWDKEVESTSHPVEKGIAITDTIRNKPVALSLSGNIVNVGTKKATTIVDELEKLKKEGSLITFVGRRTGNNLQIQSFKTSHPNTIWGGCKFEMELKEVRIAKKAYVAPKTAKSVKLEVGSIVVFKGGAVYVSSDATKAAATRSRSTCKITKISTHSWSIHQYHLISTDGGKVYGWVDKKNIEGTGNSGTVTKEKTSAGTQQTAKPSSNTRKKVFHDIKDGEVLDYLVKTTYKDNYQEDGSRINVPYVQLHSANKNSIEVQMGNYPLPYYKLIVGKELFVGYDKPPASQTLTQIAARNNPGTTDPMSHLKNKDTTEDKAPLYTVPTNRN